MQLHTILLTTSILAASTLTAHADDCAALTAAPAFIKSKFAVKVTGNAGVPGERVDVTMTYNGGNAPRVVLLPGPPVTGANVKIAWKITTDPQGAQELPNSDNQVYRFTDIAATNATARRSLQFHPLFDQARQRFLVATIQLSGTSGACAASIPLAAVPITQPLWKIPQLVLGYREINFGTGLPEKDRAVMLWTNGGPVDATQLMAQANGVLATATALQDFIDFKAYLEPLKQATSLAIPHKLAEPKSDQTGAGTGTAVKDLGGWWPLIESFPAHVNCEDIIKSMIVIGAAGKKLEVFNNKNFATDQGAMEITVGPGGVSILKDMAISVTAAGPVPMTIGGSSRITALAKGSYPIIASVTWPKGNHQITSIGGEISSMRWQ